MTQPDNFVIRTTSLSKSFGSVQALSNVSLSIPRHSIFGFLGPNGAGKSTMIKLLMGQIFPSSGTASLFDQQTGSPAARTQVGYLPENPAFYDFLSAREYLNLVGQTFGMGKELLQAESDRVLEMMGLTDAANRPMRGYSKGMVQRLGLAQALLHDPDLYILDEPMSGLDPVGRALVKQVMLQLKEQGKTVFFSTHVIADVEAVCDRVGIIAAGYLQAVYDVSQVLKSGIEGYNIQVQNCDPEKLAAYQAKDLGNGRRSVLVPTDQYQEFMEMIFRDKGQIDFVEPQRRSLEALFLDIVGKVA